MKRLQLSLFAFSIVSLMLACQPNRSSKKTGQDNGFNTIDSTKSQTSGTIAPGRPPDSSEIDTDTPLAAPSVNSDAASGASNP
jgi:hypothetical protein